MKHETDYVVKIAKGRHFKKDLKAELEISEDLNSDLSRQPELYQAYARIAAFAKAKAERLEYRIEEYENELDLKIRAEIDKSEKKPTENHIKALIKTDAGRKALINRWISAKEQYEIAMAAERAFNHRKDCLISLGANRRAEHDLELSISEKGKGKK